MTHEQKLVAQAAKNLTSQADWNVLFDGIEKELFEQWAATSDAHKKERESLHKIMSAVRFSVRTANVYATSMDFEENRDVNIPDA
jgi:hypothetical protein